MKLDPSKSIRLFYITTLPDTQWFFLKGQNRFMADRGFELHSVTSPGPLLDELASRDKIFLHPVKIVRSQASILDLWTFVRIFFVLRRIRPHIVHLSTPKAALLGSLASRITRVPVRMFFIRGLHTENKTGLSKIIFRLAEKLTARLCNSWVCVSSTLFDFARVEQILPTSKGVILGKGMSNGIDTKHFDPIRVKKEWDLDEIAHHVGLPKNVPVIGYVGRLVKDKGIHELAASWNSIRNIRPDAHLLIVGEWWTGPDAVDRDVRKSLENDSRVHFAGQVPDPAPYYALMSLVIVPSHGTEGFSNVLMEASAMCLPVIGTRVIGCVDAIVDGVTGTIVTPRNVPEITEAILEYLDDEALRHRCGEAGRQRAMRDFRPEIIWNELYKEYVRLLEAHGIATSGLGGAHGSK